MTHDLSKSLRKLVGNIILVQLLALVVLVVALTAMNISMKSQIAEQMLLAARNDFLTGDFRQAILRIETANREHFEAIGYFRDGQKIFSMPSNVVSSIFDGSDIWNKLHNVHVTMPVVFDGSQVTNLGDVTFIFSRFEVIPHAILLWTIFLILTLPMWFRTQRRMIRDYRKEIELQEQRFRAQMAQQVAHDIRSPLAALTMVTSDLQELPEENRLLIRSAVQRIHDIANDLAGKKSKSTGKSEESDELSLQLLSGIVDTLISEKRLQHRSKIGVEIDGQLEKSSYGLFAKIQPVEFKRVLSNLINNAVEGIGSSGRIDIKLFSEKNQIRLRVSDNGKGIPPEILPRLMQRGETHGKSGGSGLGLYHAKSSVEKWDGSVTIESTLGVGTTVTISLPLQDPPQWFVPQLELASQSTVVIVDDDNSIHQIWKGRFESSDPTHQIKLMHFSTPDEMSNWYRDQNGDVENIIFLCDYEFLGNEKTGLDIVRELKNQKNTILVTSRFEEEAVRKGCEKLGVRLIPKNLAGFVPLYLSAGHSASRARSQKDNESKSEIDAVLIDDDDLVHMNWKMAAKRQDKIIRIYANPDTFWKEAMTLPKDIPIYVDSNLADGIKGEDVTWMMRKKGFSNLHLATGYDASQFDDMPWIKSIVGKAPPWR